MVGKKNRRSAEIIMASAHGYINGQTWGQKTLGNRGAYKTPGLLCHTDHVSADATHTHAM